MKEQEYHQKQLSTHTKIPRIKIIDISNPLNMHIPLQRSMRQKEDACQIKPLLYGWPNDIGSFGLKS
jgi:hypothetical protein